MADFGTLNWSILVLYILLNLLLGWYLSKQVDTAEDFYLGRRTTPWWAIGISVIATYVSALSFLGGPAWSYSESLAVIAIHLNYPIVVLVVITFFLPFFFNSGVASIYDYMERRFGPTSRVVISGVFLISQALTSAAILYATSLVIEFITGIDVKAAIVIVTVVALIYTMMGGITAVIWTDVIQAGVLFVGAFIILFALVDSMPMPFGEALADLKARGKTNPLNFSFDLTAEATVWSGVIAMSLFHITVYGANQMMVQRTLAAKNIGDAKKSFLLMGFVAFFIYFLFFFLGILFYAYYGGQEFENGNTIILSFAADYGLPGLMGIIAAAIVAASMSSLDSSFNSLSTISTVDFYQKYFRKNESPEHYLKASGVLGNPHHRPGDHVLGTGRLGAANAEQDRLVFRRRQAQHVRTWVLLETSNRERAVGWRCSGFRHDLVPLDAD
jgi:SSS family solute:Na+ symporter